MVGFSRLVQAYGPWIAFGGTDVRQWRLSEMMCFNKKVIGGLAIVAIAIVVIAPNLFLTALPLLVVAACPLSMLLMGRAMMGGQRAASDQPAAASQVGSPHDRAEQVAHLRAQLDHVTEQQRALAQRLEELQAEDAPPPTKVLQEANEVARAAEARAGASSVGSH